MPGQHEDLNSLDDMDTLPPDLEDVHRLLLRDGARWRARLPDPVPHTPTEQQDARVDRRVETPVMDPPSGARGSQHIQQNIRKEVVRLDTTRIDDVPRPPIAAPPADASRLRGFMAVGAAVAIVALFAALLYSFAPGRATIDSGGKKPTPTPAIATTTPTGNPQSNANGLQQQPAVPVLASDGVTIYESAPSMLRRSDDGGKSWHTLTLPSDSGTNAADVSILVSPLDPQKAILQVTAYQAQGVTTCPTAFAPGGGATVASNGAVPLSANIPSSGSITCTVQYFSADSGQHWTHLHAPSGAVLGNKNPDASVPGIPSSPIFAQGNSLYTYAGCGPLCMDAGYRILRSTDGGATWSYADGALANQSAHVCSFMPAPSGTTIFALTNTVGCQMGGVASNFGLWSSTDAGAHWSPATLPAGSQTPQSVFVVSHANQQPLLYLNTQAPPQPHIGAGPSTPTDLHVSADGGQHWSASPASGVPAGSTTTFGPLGVLSDGIVIEPFFAQSGGQSHPTFYGWKQGDAAWHALGQPITGDGATFASLTVVSTDTGKPDQLWVVTATNTGQGVMIYDVSILTVGK